jgi:hypothetical protein
MDTIAEIMRLFSALPDEKKELVIEKARELLAEQKAREADHG